MSRKVETVSIPLQTWSKASKDTSKHSWGLTIDARTEEPQVSRIYKIK